MADDLSPQLKIQQQINEVLVERTSLLNSHTKILVTQLDLVVKIRNALKGDGLKEAEKAVRSVSGALDEATQNSEKATSAINTLAEAQESAAKKAKEQESSLKSLEKGLHIFFSGIGAGISTVMNLATSVFNVTASFVKLGLSILSIPFKMLSSFIEMAQTLPRNTAIADALEDIREGFGNLKESSGKALASQLATINHEASNLAGTGLSVTRVFGFGAEGVAGALKAINELAAGTGEAFSRLKDTFKSSGLQLVMMQKGLGLAAEGMGKLMNLAEIRGQNVGNAMTEFSSITMTTAKSFNIDVKAMAHGMVELNEDIGNFGHLGPKAFAPMVAYAKKLGIEVKQLGATMSKFSGFTDTAQAASQLAQGFGLNIDAMKLMAAQNPADKIDILRKSFFAAGKDMSKMSYQQRQYLAQQTGLEGANLEAAFSLDKQGIAYKNIEKQAKLAAKSQMTQKKVMKELGDQIKKLNHLMEVEKYTGFFDAFAKGFGVGLLKTKELRGVLVDMRTALYRIHLAGREVARIFVKEFPGVKDMLVAIRDFFEPARFEVFATRLVKAFKNLFNTQISWGEFFDEIGQLFTDQTGPSGKLFTNMKEGFKKMADFLISGVGNTITWIAEKLYDNILPAIHEFSNKLAVKLKANPEQSIFGILLDMSGGTDIAGSMGEMMQPIMKALENAWTMIKPQMLSLWDTLWPELQPRVEKAVDKIAFWAGMAFASGFVKSVGSHLLGAGATSLLKQIPVLFKKLFTGATGAKGGGGGMRWLLDEIHFKFLQIGEGMSGIFNRLAPFFNKIMPTFGRIVFKSLGPALLTGAKWALKRFPLVLIALSLYEGIKKGFESRSVLEGIQEFGASFLNTITLGIFGKRAFKNLGETINQGLNDLGDFIYNIFRSDETIKKIEEEMNDRTKWAKEMILSHQKEFNDAIIKGNRQAAIAAAVEMRIQEEMTKKGGLLVGKSATSDKAEILRSRLQAEAQKVAEEGFKKYQAELKKKAAKKLSSEERKTLDKISAAHKMIDMTNDLFSLQERLVNATKKLQKMNSGQIAMDIEFVTASLMAALSVIPKALNADGLTKMKDETSARILNFSMALSTAFQPLTTLTDTLMSLSSRFKAVSSSTFDIAKSMNDAPFAKVTKEMDNFENMILRINSMVENVVTADGILTPEKIAKMTPILEAMKGFTGGKLSVSHNLPNTKIEISVDIDSRNLGKELIAVNLGHNPHGADVYSKMYIQGGSKETKMVRAPIVATRGK